LTDKQLAEAVALNAVDNLPLPLSELYLDWQTIEKKNGKIRTLISLISKKIANDYIEALKKNGFKLIALETTFLSIERAIHIPEEPTILIYLSDEGITSIVYNKKRSYLNRFESWPEASCGKEIKKLADLNEIIKKEIRNLTVYFENRYRGLKIKKVLIMSYGHDSDRIVKKIGKVDFPIEKVISKIENIENEDWIPVAGAAARAFIPRSDDTIISLLPVGTESIYETQKAVSFAKSILLLSLAVCFFYIAVFAATYFFVSFEADNVKRQFDLRNSLPVSQEYQKIESETKSFNSYVSDLKNIYAQINTNYADVLKDINNMALPGIVLTRIDSTDFSKKITVSGLATSRSSLNVFRSRLKNHTSFRKVKFSIPNIAQKNNISFNIEFFHK